MQHNSPTISPAGVFLLKAVDRIHYTGNAKKLLDRLDREFIQDVWQLQYLDSYQWESLKAPIGLVAAVRRCLEEERKNNRKKETDRSRLTPSRNRPQPNRPPPSDNKMQIPEEIRLAPTPEIASTHRLSVRLQNGLPLPLYPEDEDGDEGAQEASMMTTPKKSNASLTNSFATMLSNYASSTSVSPKQHEESIDTFFPPPMPERQKSQPDMPTENVEDSCCTAEDHWTSCATSSSRKDSLKFPPIVPSRLASLEPAPANCKTRQE